MFGNLKSKIGDVTDLKKLSSPQALSSVAGSRQRSSQHTPGSITPRSHHSRQASTASLQGLGLPMSPPQSPSDHNGSMSNNDRTQEMEREINKLRTTLETQQDAALERLNAREQEWKERLQEGQNKVINLSKELEAAVEREKKLQQHLDGCDTNKKQLLNQLSQAQARVKGLESKVVELQDNYDQMEGLNTQEVAKIKHMLLNTNSELEEVKADLQKKTEALTNADARLSSVVNMEERIRLLSEEKTEFESQVAGLNHRLIAANAKYTSLEEEKEEEAQHLQDRIVTLEQRHSQTSLQETDRVQALIKEREAMEHRLEEARQQLNNIKASWSDKITAMENQIHNLNQKMAEDQADFKKAEEEKESLKSSISALQGEVKRVTSEKCESEQQLQSEIERLKEDHETLRWQLDNTTFQKQEEITSLQEKLKEEENLHQTCANDLQSKEERVSALECKCSETESELATVKDNLSAVSSQLLAAQNESKSLREALAQERTALDVTEKSKMEISSKLEVITSEKLRLSQNLDEYVAKISVLEESLNQHKEVEESDKQRISYLESDLSQSQLQCQILSQQLENSHEDLLHKIEESDIVKELRLSMKTLEDELTEKKQTLKVQGQRLADMKKTIQRELKLGADSVDSVDTRQQVPSPTLICNSSGNDVPVSAPSTTITTENGEPINHAYLKHVIIKYLTSREYEAVHLTRAVATLLHMTSEEERLLRETLEWKMSWFGSKPNLGKGQDAKTIPPSQ